MSGAGPEERNLLADDNEEWAKHFFEVVVNWKLITKNYDIRKSDRGQKRGLDLVFQCFDPFTGKIDNLVVEAKHRQDDDSMTTKNIGDMIKDLKDKIELAKITTSWTGTNFESTLFEGEFLPGVLFLKLEMYDHESISDSIKRVVVEGTNTNPPVIGIMTNRRLAQILSLTNKKENLEFYYPVFGKNRVKAWHPFLSFTYLFSDIIAGRYKEFVRGNGKEKVIDRYFILSFEEPTLEAVKYITDAIIAKWYLGEHQVDVYFTEANDKELQKANSLKDKGSNYEIKALGIIDERLNFKIGDI